MYRPEQSSVLITQPTCPSLTVLSLFLSLSLSLPLPLATVCILIRTRYTYILIQRTASERLNFARQNGGVTGEKFQKRDGPPDP